ncbi:MAG: carbon storage regulator [Patescibacteria group bacterium]|nr:carbon storage regulator [Patescibacteria group bacterium]
MLVLSRKTHQRIRLGDEIVVTVIGVAGDRVRLSIEAPSDIRVLREELDRLPSFPTEPEGTLVEIGSALTP